MDKVVSFSFLAMSMSLRSEEVINFGQDRGIKSPISPGVKIGGKI
jgi:hypothetical protein